jgi:hypothetical protein
MGSYQVLGLISNIFSCPFDTDGKEMLLEDFVYNAKTLCIPGFGRITEVIGGECVNQSPLKRGFFLIWD